jgi:hypothetical protein
MTVPEFARLVAQMDRLWFGAGLTEAMKADQAMFREWYELLAHVDADVARQAIQELNAELGRPPTPGQIARRAGDIGTSKILALPDPELTREATPEERAAVSRRLPELRAVIARLSAGKALEVSG